MRRLAISVSAEELAEFGTAPAALDHTGLGARSHAPGLAAKLQTMLRAESKVRMESDLEMPVQAEGLARRPGPMERLDRGLLSLLHQTITTCREVEFCCFAQSTRRRNRQQVRPSACSIETARTWWGEPSGPRSRGGGVPRNMSEARTTGQAFERSPAFDLQRFAESSFGTFQEKPVKVVLRFDAGAARDTGGVPLPSGPEPRGKTKTAH